MTLHPTAAVIMRFSLRSFLFCFHFCFVMRSSCSGWKSESILGAVFSSSVCEVSLFPRLRRRLRTFAWFEGRPGGWHRDEQTDRKDEKGKEFALLTTLVIRSETAKAFGLPVHRRYNPWTTYWVVLGRAMFDCCTGSCYPPGGLYT